MPTIPTSLLEPEVLDLGANGPQAAVATVEDTTGLFDSYRVQFRAVPGRSGELYVPSVRTTSSPTSCATLWGPTK